MIAIHEPIYAPGQQLTEPVFFRYELPKTRTPLGENSGYLSICFGAESIAKATLPDYSHQSLD